MRFGSADNLSASEHYTDTDKSVYYFQDISAYISGQEPSAFLCAAFIIYVFLEKKLSHAVISAAFSLLAILIVSCAVSCVGLSLGISATEQLEIEKVPYSHWIMMSMIGNGGFASSEYSYTVSFKGYDEKKAAVNERIKEHIEEYTLRSFTDHIVEKSAYTWGDAYYYSPHHLRKSNKTEHYSLITSDENGFKIYSDAAFGIRSFAFSADMENAFKVSCEFSAAFRSAFRRRSIYALRF